MAASSPPLISEHSKKKKPNKRKRTQKGQEGEKLDSLKWNPSISANDNHPSVFLAGSNKLDGGFLSLEEIDEANYNLQIAKLEKGKSEKKPNMKKRKHSDANEDSGDGGEDGSGEQKEEEKSLKNEKGKKKKGKKTKTIEESVAGH